MGKPKDWQEGRYQWDRSFLWNLIHYKSVDYSRCTDCGETEKIRDVLMARLILLAIAGLWGLTFITKLIGG